MLAAARAKSKGVDADFVPGRAENPPFPDEAFDRVTAPTLLCLVPDRARVLSEMARVLKPGGWLVLGDLGARSLWALIRKARGRLGARLWRVARFHTAAEMRVSPRTPGSSRSICGGASTFRPSAG